MIIIFLPLVGTSVILLIPTLFPSKGGVGLSFIRRTGVVLLLLLFASFVFLLLSQLLSCALLNLYFRICTLYLLEYDCTS